MRAKASPFARKLVVSLALLAVIWVAMLVFGGGRADGELLSVIYIGEHSRLVRLAHYVGRLGGWPVLLLVTLAAAVLLASRGKYWLAPLPLAATYAVNELGILMRTEVARPRPNLPGAYGLHAPSFPSVHAADTVTAYLLVALLLRRPGKVRRRLAAVAVLVSFLVGLSRAVLGHHWPSDVIAGWAFGTAAALLSYYVASLLDQRRSARLVRDGERNRAYR